MFKGGWPAFTPLHLEHGYRIERAGTVPERNEFVWEVIWDGPDEEWDARQEAYYSSPERLALDPDPAQWIAKRETWFVNSVLPE